MTEEQVSQAVEGLLQWSRDPKTAETASILITQYPTRLLQWSRDPKTAETESRRLPTALTREGFNGAAILRPRKHVKIRSLGKNRL